MAYRPSEKSLARKAELRQRLLDCALHMIADGGFGALTIVALTAQANIATGAVYKHFESKADLCVALFRMATEKEVALLRSTLAQPGSPAELLRHTIQVFAERALRKPQLAFALMIEPIDPLVEAERLHYHQAYVDVFEGLVKRGMACGEFAPQNTWVSAAALVGVIAESLLGQLSKPRPGQATLPPAELIAALQAFCLRAVGASIGAACLSHSV